MPVAYPLLVALEGEVRHQTPQLPHLDGLVKRGRGECVVVLRVDHNLHHVVGVA